MSPSVLPSSPPEGRTLPGQSTPSPPSTSPLTLPPSSAPGSNVESNAASGEAFELIIPENEGLYWFLQTLEKVATVMGEDDKNDVSKDLWMVDGTKNSHQVLKKPLPFSHLDEAKQRTYIGHYF